MANVVVAESHLTYGGLAYFRGNAEQVEVGSIGEKRTPLTKQNYLEVKDRIPVDKIHVAQATVVDIDFTKTSKAAFNTNVSAVIEGVPVKVTGDAAFEKMRSGTLKLVKFAVPGNQMKEAANSVPARIRDLADWGNDARIAHQVFIVMDAQLATKFNNNANATLSVGIKGLQAQVGGGGSSSGSTTVQISKGSCFAYLLLKIQWNAAAKKDRTRIVDLNDDQWGMG